MPVQVRLRALDCLRKFYFKEETLVQEHDLAFQKIVDGLLPDTKDLKILEAGAGSLSYIHFPLKSYKIGIDISQEQLERNTLLNEKILGDIQTYDFPAEVFDVIVCWNVLEHLDQPIRALKNLARSLKKGGIMVLALPNVFSLKGLITKFTPHSFHVWYYRYLRGSKRAGQRGYAPFPAFLKFSIAPASLRRLAEKEGFRIEYSCVYEREHQREIREKFPIINSLLNLVNTPLKWLCGNRWDGLLSDFILILRKCPE